MTPAPNPLMPGLPLDAGWDEEQLRQGEQLFRLPCSFVKGVVSAQDLPESTLPEAAFAGRSNVGKSSLLNALVNRKALARTSNTPGRTREVNYFQLGNALYLVDMPGYGYAAAPKAQVKGWTALIHDYLKGRAQLKRVFLLIDGRHGLKIQDRAIMALMDKAAVSYQAVLTKIDKVKDPERERIMTATAGALAKHPAAHPQIIPTSSVKGWGIPELRAAIASLGPH